MSLLLAVLAVSARADLRERSVTYASFLYVHHVASTISHVYFATTNGVIRYHKLQQRWEQPLTSGESVVSLRGEVIERVYTGRFDDKLYGQTAMGEYEYDLLFNSWFPLIDIPELENNYVHLPTPDDLIAAQGSNYFGGGRFADIFGRSYRITDVIDDNTGTLWIATWGYGPAKAGTSSRVVEHLPFGLLQSRTDVMYREDSLIWMTGQAFGQSRTGLTAFSPEGQNSLFVESGLNPQFPVADINCLTSDDEYLYLGTDNGVLVLDRRTWSLYQRVDRRHGIQENHITALHKSGDSLFIGTTSGLSVLYSDLDSLKQVYSKQFTNHVIYALERKSNDLWIASSSGAYVLSLATNDLVGLVDTTRTIFSRVFEIEIEGPYVWLCAPAGLVRLDSRNGELKAFRDLSVQNIGRPMAVHREFAAVASSHGVSIFKPESEHPFVQEITTNDGLVSDNVLSLLVDDTYLWVGTDRGVTRIEWNNSDFLSH